MRRIGLPLFAALLLFLVSPAKAGTVIDTIPSWSGSITSGWLNTAQTFTSPADNILDNYTFVVAERAGGGTIGFSIVAWSAGNPDGPALYSADVAWPEAGGPILVGGINLALTPGNLYAAVIDLKGYGGNSVYYTGDAYPGGNGFWSDDQISWSDFPFLDHAFRAEFRGGSAVPEPASLVMAAIGVAGAMGISRRRRRNAMDA